MKKLNKLTAVLLSLALCLGMVAPAFAASFDDLQNAIDADLSDPVEPSTPEAPSVDETSVEPSIPQNGDWVSTDDSGNDHYGFGWSQGDDNKWNHGIEAWDDAETGRNVKLNEDVRHTNNIESPIKIGEEQNVVLDLNGKTIDGQGKHPSYQGSAITVTGKDASLTLKDGASGGAVTAGGNSQCAEGVVVDNGASFTMQGGSINGFGGGHHGVNVKDGTFTMNGGEISGNSRGAVAVSGTDSSFTMNDGKISGNTSNGSGAGVSVSGGATFTMNNGEISGNKANGTGGGVDVSAGSTFNMTGGSIISNTAGSGGGIYGNEANINLVAGADKEINISQNTGTNNGGGLMATGGNLEIDGVTMEDNTTPGVGGAMFINGNGSAVNISNTTMRNNSAGTIGSAMRLMHRVFNILNTAMVKENASSDYAISIGPRASVNLQGTTAISGSGILVGEGGYLGVDESVAMEGGTVYLNSGCPISNNGFTLLLDKDNNLVITDSEGNTVDAILDGSGKRVDAGKQDTEMNQWDGYEIELTIPFSAIPAPVVPGDYDDLAASETEINDPAVPLAAGPVTRAQFVDYLWRHEGSPEAEGELFADHEYAPAIAWVLSVGLIDEAFQPDELVTVADVRAILGSFTNVFGTNAVAVADLTTLTGADDEAVLNCDQVLAQFFGEEYILPEDLDILEPDIAA